MRLVAAFVCAACLVAAGAQASPRSMLGIDYERGRLAWFDPATLTPLPGRKVEMPGGACSWSLSVDRAQLAYSNCERGLVFVDARTMRRVAAVDVAQRLTTVENLVWLRPDRLLATTTQSTLLVIDPRTRRVLRRVTLPGPVSGRRVLADGRIAYLTSTAGAFGPARVAIADADGNLRVAEVGRISTGTVYDADSRDPHGTVRSAGFAVDLAGARAYVVSPELLVAEVDLATLAVSYHGATRVLAKSIEGPMRSAAWLGDGLLAVSGADYATTGAGSARKEVSRPFGLYVVDTRTWTVRLVDPAGSWFRQAPGLLLADRGAWEAKHAVVAYGLDGTERYRIALEPRWSLATGGGFGYVCDGMALVRMMDLASGTSVAAPAGRSCVTLLDGPASEW